MYPGRQERRLLSPAGSCVLAVTLLSVGIGQPAEAQGFLKKFQETTRSIREEIQDRGEKADTAMSKAGETVDAVECLASDSTCSEPSEAQVDPPLGADSSGSGLPVPARPDTAPPACQSKPAATAEDGA